MNANSETNLDWLADLRQRMLNSLLGVLVVLGGIGILASIYRVWMGESPRNLVYYLPAYLLALLLFFAPRLPYLNKISHDWRAYIFLAALYAFSVMALFSGWLVSGGRTFLVALVVAAAVLVGTRAGFVVAVLDLVTFAAFGFAYSLHWIELRALPDPTTPAPIVTEGVGFAMAVGIAVLGLWLIRRALNTAIQATQEAGRVRQELFERAQQLDEANRLLSGHARSLEQANAALQERVWSATAHGRLDDALRGEQDAQTLCDRVLGALCRMMDAQVGAFYALDEAVCDDEPGLSLLGKYAFAVLAGEHEIEPAQHFCLGEGLVGQTAKTGQMIHVPGLELKQAISDRLALVQSAIGQALPASILLVPVFSGGKVNGVIELGALEGFNPLHIEFLEASREKIGATLASARARERIQALVGERG